MRLLLEKKNGHHHMPETRGLCLCKEQTVSSVHRRPRLGGHRLVGMKTKPQKLTRKCEVTATLVLCSLPRQLPWKGRRLKSLPIIYSRFQDLKSAPTRWWEMKCTRHLQWTKEMSHNRQDPQGRFSIPFCWMIAITFYKVWLILFNFMLI